MVSGLIASLLVSEQPLPRVVELPDGSKHELHFKQLPARAFRVFFDAVALRNEDEQSRAMAHLISQSLCTADGQPVLSLEQALRLTVPAERELANAVLDANGLGAKAEVELGNGSPGVASSGSGTS